MGEPFSTATGVLAIAGITLKSSVALCSLLRGLQSQNKDARALKAEVSDLSDVLSSLFETIANNPTLDFDFLKRPLERCDKACKDYAKIIDRCTKHCDTSRSSKRDWIKQKYLQGDINDFRALLAAHKSTVNIALANANLRIAAITPEVLDSYKDMISDTTHDLNAYLKDLQEKIDRLKAGDAAAVDDVAIEWQAMLEEKESTQQGLNMCARFSAQIAQFESASTEHTQFSKRPSAHKHIKTGLNGARGSFQSLLARLQTHEALVNSQMEMMSLQETLSEPVAAQLAQLQQTKDSVSECKKIVSEASELADERSNVFEDITLADNSYAFSVSTVKELVTARRLNLSGRSRHFGAQASDETVQKAIEALTELDKEHIRTSNNAHVRPQNTSVTTSNDPNSAKKLYDHFGPITTFAASKSRR